LIEILLVKMTEKTTERMLEKCFWLYL